MKNKFFEISLNGLEFFSKIGFYKEERINGNKFLIDIDLRVKYSSMNDELQSTVNYEKVYDCIAEIMNSRVKLLETIAESINYKILSTFQKVESCKTKICKMNPRIKGKAKSSNIILETYR